MSVNEEGAMMIGEMLYGPLLYADDNSPRICEVETEDILPEGEESPALDESDIGEADAAPVEAPVETMKRLIVRPYPMETPDGDFIYLDDEENRERYEPEHLRLTNAQIDALKQLNYAELMYEVEYATLRLPIDALTSEIDLNNFTQPGADAPADAAVAETAPQPEPVMQPVNMYDIFVEQVDPAQLSARESAALTGMTSLLPLYRVQINAVDGEIQPDTAMVPVEGEVPAEGEAPVVPTFYPMLRVFNAPQLIEAEPAAEMPAEEMPAEEQLPEALTDPTQPVDPWAQGQAILRVTPELPVYILPEGAQQVFVATDELLPDAEAVRLTDANYIVTDLEQYAEFYPTESGMCTIIAPAETGEDDSDEGEEAIEEDIPEEPISEDDASEDEEEIDEEADEEDEDFEEEEEDEGEDYDEEEEEQAGAADPDSQYAYVLRSSQGNMYWLIDTAAGTVEFFRSDSGAYQIGDYTGNLAGGIAISYRDSGESATFRLKFPQLYKFAVTDVDGSDALLELTDTAAVEQVMQGAR